MKYSRPVIRFSRLLIFSFAVSDIKIIDGAQMSKPTTAVNHFALP